MGLLDTNIPQYSRPPRISKQLPAHHQTTQFAMEPQDDNTVGINFRWLGYAVGLRALSDFSTTMERPNPKQKICPD